METEIDNLNINIKFREILYWWQKDETRELRLVDALNKAYNQGIQKAINIIEDDICGHGNCNAINRMLLKLNQELK